jgi:hypothetical protein
MSTSLVTALAAEEAAIYGYGALGVYLADAERAEARAAEAVHRGRRDALVLRLAALHVAPSAAPAGYQLPFAVTDRQSALKLAIAVEERIATTWRAALATVDVADRGTVVDALTEAAVRATRWRRFAGLSPVTVPFPGKA